MEEEVVELFRRLPIGEMEADSSTGIGFEGVPTNEEPKQKKKRRWDWYFCSSSFPPFLLLFLLSFFLFVCSLSVFLVLLEDDRMGVGVDGT